MFVFGKVDPSKYNPQRFAAKTLWGPKQELGGFGRSMGLREPQARASFDPSLQALGYAYRGAFGADPMEGLRGVGLGDRLKAARRGDREGTPESAMREIFGYLEARPEDAEYFNRIFSQFGQKDLFRASHSSRHLDPLFREEFLGGAHAYFQEKGDWEWDFDSNQWRRSQAGQARFSARRGRQRLLDAGPMSTRTRGFGKTNVQKETY